LFSLTELQEQRLFSKIEITGFCWNWLGKPRSQKTKAKYGTFWLGQNRYLAHRFVYEYLVGNIPVDLQIDHLCRNTLCVNPDHLEPVTAQENLSRSFGMGAVNARKIYCVNNHPLSGSNLFIASDNSRQCKICRTARMRIASALRTQRRREAANK
jgi:hypothetical protein